MRVSISTECILTSVRLLGSVVKRKTDPFALEVINLELAIRRDVLRLNGTELERFGTSISTSSDRLNPKAKQNFGMLWSYISPNNLCIWMLICEISCPSTSSSTEIQHILYVGSQWSVVEFAIESVGEHLMLQVQSILLKLVRRYEVIVSRPIAVVAPVVVLANCC